MFDDFMYVLENYPDANLASESAREMIATALVNIMCEHHIVSYTDLDAVKNDPKMTTWISYCKSKKDDRDIEKTNQMEIPFERGL
tara:strand:- start:3371 stop:3625 length:255 start_codon:yes stop_codon:yes gene_type:complete